MSVSLLCLLHCVCCIASRSKRSQVIGSTGLGGANSALRLLLPMSSSSAILHSISLKLQQTSRAAGLFLIDGRVSCKPNEGGGNVFLLGIRAQERCHRAYRGRRLPKIINKIPKIFGEMIAVSSIFQNFTNSWALSVLFRNWRWGSFVCKFCKEFLWPFCLQIGAPKYFLLQIVFMDNFFANFVNY